MPDSTGDLDRRRWDAIVIGTGSGGKSIAQQLAAQNRSVLAVEALRFGGECPYVACVPAKSILASAHAGLDWADAIAQRDDITDGRDDSASRASLDQASVTTLRGRAALLGDGDRDFSDADKPSNDAGAGVRQRRVKVVAESGDDVVHTAPVVVLATGSRPTIPPMDGLDHLDYWTSDVALSIEDQPESLIVLGGGPVGCELAQAFARFGTAVHLVEVAPRLLPAEAAWAGEALANRLRNDGVRLHLGQTPSQARLFGDQCQVELPDGTAIRAERVLVAGGREPRTDDLGLDSVGAQVDKKSKAVSVDARCRVLRADGSAVDGLYAVGDVTSISNYTHSANYQAKIAAADIIGEGRDADYAAVPRAVYTEPAVFAVGLTEDQAADKGIRIRTARSDINDVERAALLQRTCAPGQSVEIYGGIEVLVDADRGVVVGATCVGPQADAWGAELALAIRARVDLRVLCDHLRAFPTWSEGITLTLDNLTQEYR
jgi:pyruvate/2-oxoglutarate dehydrogenase complex dihydrolipoamide dehydrogenase (E3) component